MKINKNYYAVHCEHCGWIGSSEECPSSEDWFTCPKCYKGEPEEMTSLEIKLFDKYKIAMEYAETLGLTDEDIEEELKNTPTTERSEG